MSARARVTYSVYCSEERRGEEMREEFKRVQ
jgi:hypothetical protein